MATDSNRMPVVFLHGVAGAGRAWTPQTAGHDPTGTQMSIIDRHNLEAPIFDRAAFRLAENEAELIEERPRFDASGAAPRNTIATRPFLIENFRDMHEAGLLAICAAGGGRRGASLRTYCLAAAELGRYCGATALSWNMHVLDAVDRR